MKLTKKHVYDAFLVALEMQVNSTFYVMQRLLGITDGSEPFDSKIDTIEKQLAKECTEVLLWQYNSEQRSKE